MERESEGKTALSYVEEIYDMVLRKAVRLSIQSTKLPPTPQGFPYIVKVRIGGRQQLTSTTRETI